MAKTRFACLIAVLALCSWVGRAQAAIIVIDDFDPGEDHFTSAPNASGTSSGFFLNSTSTADRVTNTPSQGTIGSQRLFINDDPAVDPTSPTIGGEWVLRHLSGGATATNNVNTNSTGNVGYWYKTTVAGMEAALIIDEASVGTSNERSSWKPIIADGQWHAVEWSLDATIANTEWFNFSGGNGLPQTTWASIDALLFRKTSQDPAGGGDYDAEFFLDTVSYTTTPGESIVPVPEPASGLLLVASAAMLIKRRRLRQT